MYGLVGGIAALVIILATVTPSQSRQTRLRSAPSLDLTIMLPSERMAALATATAGATNPDLMRHGARKSFHRVHGHPARYGVVRSGKTGATARVAARHVRVFQAYINDVEAAGARILFMGGIRHGHCRAGSQHPCGMAIDLCQIRRAVVDRRCRLPGPSALIEIATRHGLTEGAQWCNSDYGHAQVQPTGGTCGLLSARRHRHR